MPSRLILDIHSALYTCEVYLQKALKINTFDVLCWDVPLAHDLLDIGFRTLGYECGELH